MKLVKIIATNVYALIDQATYDADPSLYIDRSSSPYYWLNHYADAGLTFWQSRYHVKLVLDAAAGGFNDASFTDYDRDALGIYAYGDKTDIHSFYEAYFGLSATDAQGLNLQRSAAARVLLATDAKVILASPKIMEIGVKYLSEIVNGEFDSSQAFQLTSALAGFFAQYRDFAVLGTDYDDEQEGIMDYLEATHNYSSGGSKNYDINPAVLAQMPGPTDPEKETQAWTLMVGEFQELFVKGNG